jgi:hypothetical protein
MMKYWWLVAWANVCKWGWWTWRKVGNLWSSTPERCRVYIGIMAIVVLLSLSIKAFADHKVPPLPGDDPNAFVLATEVGPVVCGGEADEEDLYTCWPFRVMPKGMVFGKHGWCFTIEHPFKEGGKWQCSISREEALRWRQELDGLPI